MTQKQTYLCYAGFGILVLAWAVLQSQIRITADAAWLTLAAERFLSGQSMTEAFFEINPPLSILIYIPATLLKGYGAPIWHALNIYTWLLTILALALSAAFLRQWNLSHAYNFLFLAGYITVVTLASILCYAQRDHFSAIALLPFLMAQLSITYNHKVDRRLLWLTLIIFCPFILLKPHYGLLPTALLAHRIYLKKDFRIVLDPDFIALSTGVIAYIAGVFLFFPDFINTILWTSIDMYIGRPVIDDVMDFVPGFIVLVSGIFVCAWFGDNLPGERKLTVIFCALAALAIIPYWVQNKGFVYHLLPFYALLLPAALGTIHLYLPKSRRILLCAAFVAFFAGMLGYVYFITKNSHHDFLNNNEIAKLVAGTAPGSNFYIEFYSTDLVLPIAAYQDRGYGSRFVANWFLYYRFLDEPKFSYYREMFGKMVVEDIERYRPEIMLLIDDGEDSFNILDAYTNMLEFQEALSDYRQEGRIASEQFYYPSAEDLKVPIPYRIFRRVR